MRNNASLSIQNPAASAISSEKLPVVFLLILHVLLAFLMRQYQIVATLHALLTFTIGVGFALFGKDEKKVVYIAAYITGAEILWRMNQANVFWEFGKYATIPILIVAFLRSHSSHARNAGLPILYFVFLCISIPLTIAHFGFTKQAQDAISFNLSGPLALAVCTLYFSQLRLSLDDLKSAAWSMVFPIFSIFTLALYGTVTANYIYFTEESNFLTSGGYGPNQVSAILGLGAVMMLLVFLTEKRKPRQLAALLLAIALLAQSALTFSRGGLLNAAICTSVLALHYFFNQEGRSRLFFGIFALLLIGAYIVYPQLNEFTGGSITLRFSDLDTTGRLELAQADIAIWQDNFLWGVGPGVSAYVMPKYIGKFAAAHTEFTRILAEHGFFGLISLVILVILAIKAYFSAPDWQSKAWTAAFIAWSFAEMGHSAMRIVAISFMFGLAFAVKFQTAKTTVPEIEKVREFGKSKKREAFSSINR